MLTQGRAEELVPGKLYVVGGYLPADGMVSWLPSELAGFQPSNCYLLVGDEQALLVDAGLACFRPEILDQLESVLPPELPLSIFLTRTELDCIGSLGAIADRFSVVGMHVGGTNNPFDAIDNVSVVSNGTLKIQRDMGSPIQLSKGRSFHIIPAPLRLLPTFWAYDDETKTLFTSDSFGHNLVARAGDSRVATTAEADVDDAAAAYLLTKFDWMAEARTAAISAELVEVFEHRDVEVIAPMHGCVIRGHSSVQRHYDAVLRALDRARPRTRRSLAPQVENVERSPDVASTPLTPERELPREIAPGIHWVGGCLPLAASSSTYHLHNTAYLLVGEHSTLLIDSGYPGHWKKVEADLDGILAGRQLDWVLPTHLETPHCGNIPRLLAKFPAACLIGDMRDCQLHYPELTERFVDRRAGSQIDLGGLHLELISAVIRDMPPTLWAYERTRQVFFVADAFGYTHGATGQGDPVYRPGECGLLSTEVPFAPSVEQTAYLTRASLYWTRFVDVEPSFEQIQELMRQFPTRAIAPAHANVITDLEALLPVMREAFRIVDSAETA